MTGYRTKWFAEKLDHWVGEKHSYPERVRLEATGEKGGPDVTVTMEMRNGVPDVVAFHIEAKEGGRPVRTSDLNAWQPLEGLAINGFRRWARPVDPAEAGPNPYGPRSERDSWQILGELEGVRASSRGPSQSELEEVARIYRDAVDGRPTEAVQVMLGYTRRTAARRISQAREAGLLPKTSQGRKNA